jgi:hypothetical protein
LAQTVATKAAPTAAASRPCLVAGLAGLAGLVVVAAAGPVPEM